MTSSVEENPQNGSLILKDENRISGSRTLNRTGFCLSFHVIRRFKRAFGPCRETNIVRLLSKCGARLLSLVCTDKLAVLTGSIYDLGEKFDVK